MFKFRTTTVLEDDGRIVQAQRNDRRVTRVGGCCGRTSTDELPQLFNVLRGEMSLVGPRPHVLAHDDASTSCRRKSFASMGAACCAALPASDIAGAHRKTYLFAGNDEIHGDRSHDLFETLAPDPTRHDVLTWITSYAGIRHAPGIPRYDFMQTRKRGDDPRMCFSWLRWRLHD